MTRIAWGVVVVLAVAALFAPALAAEGTKYGNGVSLTVATPIDKLLADPKAYVGKTVRVDGVVTAVCDMAGCWMELGPENADARAASLRFKVDDGVIVFPVSAKGKKASAEGVFGPVSAEMAKEYEMDQKKATGGDSTKVAPPTYQVKATGAIIY